MAKDKWEPLSMTLAEAHKKYLPDLSALVPWGWPYTKEEFENDHKATRESGAAQADTSIKEEGL